MRLQWSEIRARAAEFAERHKGDHYEKGETQTFYNEFFDCFGVSRRQVAAYEQRVRNLPGDKQGYIDLFWPGTLIVEQKSAGLDLKRASDQALDYYDWLPEPQRPRYILTCDFQRWHLLDLEEGREWRFRLGDLKDNVEAFAFILGVQPRLNRRQSPANVKASQLMGQLHEALAETGYGGHDLQLLLVRLLFILFADDTRIFNNKDRYSIGLVYNTFPWPDATSAQQKKIEALAQAVLDARALPKNATSSLADLYDPDTMPVELRKAHRELDLAVDKLYRARPFKSDRERVEHLFPLYEALVQPTAAAPKANRRVARRAARNTPRATQ